MLEPYDVVHVRRSPAYSEARNISVTGEVNYEGNFTLENKKMRLSDAIKMAGGVTDDAYLRGARLVRVMNEEERVREEATLEAIKNILTENGDSIASSKLRIPVVRMISCCVRATRFSCPSSMPQSRWLVMCSIPTPYRISRARDTSIMSIRQVASATAPRSLRLSLFTRMVPLE